MVPKRLDLGSEIQGNGCDEHVDGVVGPALHVRIDVLSSIYVSNLANLSHRAAIPEVLGGQSRACHRGVIKLT
jgi:hypothetical protein